jgi:hypothetical protein
MDFKNIRWTRGNPMLYCFRLKNQNNTGLNK